MASSEAITNGDIAEAKELERQAKALERIEELRNSAGNGNPSNLARNEIVERRAAEQEKDPISEHDAAVKYFDASHPDLLVHPPVVSEIRKRYDEVARRAAQKGETVDWFSELPRIGDELRREAGLPTSEEKARIEALADLKKGRYQAKY